MTGHKTTHKLYIGLGSNLQNPINQLKIALKYLANTTGFKVIKFSSFYKSPAMDKMPQPDYINAVCEIETSLSPIACLDCCQTIENKMGRIRDKTRWQARTVDLDLLLFDQQIIKNNRLVIPHYGMLHRSFVVTPLLEIAPNSKHPLLGYLKNLTLEFSEPLEKVYEYVP